MTDSREPPYATGIKATTLTALVTPAALENGAVYNDVIFDPLDCITAQVDFAGRCSAVALSWLYGTRGP